MRHVVYPSGRLRWLHREECVQVLVLLPVLYVAGY